MKEEVKYRQVIVHFGKLLHERGYVAATDANLSVRLDCQSILITPTCLHPLSESGGLCAGLQFRSTTATLASLSRLLKRSTIPWSFLIDPFSSSGSTCPARLSARTAALRSTSFRRLRFPPRTW